MKSIGSIVIGSVAGERLKSGRRIMVALANGESLLANRGVFVASGVIMERQHTLGCVSAAIDVVHKCAMADRGVIGASGVVMERSRTGSVVGSPNKP